MITHVEHTALVVTDTKAMQQINFTQNIEQAENVTTFFIIEEAKETK